VSATLESARAPTGRPLPLVELGHTGLRVSRIGLGLAGLGRPAYMTLGREDDFGSDRSMFAMMRRCKEMLDTAYAAGIRYVDAARSYGLAESFVRRWCDAHHLADDGLIVGSKWGYTYTGQWQVHASFHEVKSLTIETLRRQWAESRGILGTRLALYQIHSATLENGVLDNAPVLMELRRLRAQGLRIGLTVTGPRQREAILRALDVRVDGQMLFQTVQATWNLLEPSSGPALSDAKACGLGVIVKEALANGRLTSRHADVRLRDLSGQARALGTTLETLAFSAALAQSWADVVLTGAVTIAQLQASLAALSVDVAYRPMPPVAELPEVYWRRRATLAWT
jgi:aryl-alcohol dehydrogenase-like predicted oxidoreductase